MSAQDLKSVGVKVTLLRLKILEISENHHNKR
jgi:Fe2+ or Zn2+ uptake regulation protein